MPVVFFMIGLLQALLLLAWAATSRSPVPAFVTRMAGIVSFILFVQVSREGAACSVTDASLMQCLFTFWGK